MNEPWKDVGTTGESQFRELLFDPHSKSLVAHFYRTIADKHGVKSLYVRSANSNRYSRLTDLSDILSYEDISLSPTSPCLFANVLQARKDGDRFFGYDWYALQKISLPDGKVLGEIKDGQLPPTAGNQRTWIRAIHGVSADGVHLYCSVGIPELHEEGDLRMRYCLAKVAFDKKTYDVVSELGQTFL